MKMNKYIVRICILIFKERKLYSGTLFVKTIWIWIWKVWKEILLQYCVYFQPNYNVQLRHHNTRLIFLGGNLYFDVQCFNLHIYVMLFQKFRSNIWGIYFLVFQPRGLSSIISDFSICMPALYGYWIAVFNIIYQKRTLIDSFCPVQMTVGLYTQRESERSKCRLWCLQLHQMADL